MRPFGQLQTGVCKTTSHMALTPHDPGQGSTQENPKQALLNGQSAFTKHSGRHSGLYAVSDVWQGLQMAT